MWQTLLKGLHADELLLDYMITGEAFASILVVVELRFCKAICNHPTTRHLISSGVNWEDV